MGTGVGTGVGVGVDATKVAVTERVEFITTLQLSPEHAPEKPEKVDPLLAMADKLTNVPLGKLTWQVAPQFIPAGLLVTVPLPTFEMVNV